MFTIEPPPALRIAGIAARMPRKVPVWLTADDAVPELDRGVHDALEADDRRVVDEDVELAVGALGELHGARPVGLLADVELREDRRAARRRDLGDDLLAELAADVAEHDARALAREQPRLRLALAARGARDQGDLAVEPSHQPLPRRGS